MTADLKAARERLEQDARLMSHGEFGEDLRILLTALDQAAEALKKADEALREYACHGGPTVPCMRTPDQCASECGKIAGDALIGVYATLKPVDTKEGEG